jgi:putative heme iron utilization protein
LLESPFGKAKLSPSDLASTRPDPLWDAVDSICAHMEQDHADTFPTFLGLVGRSVEPRAAISMPWVEESGFFLSLAGEPVFVPFPRPCPAADDVRAAMIRMLRNARAGGDHTP